MQFVRGAFLLHSKTSPSTVRFNAHLLRYFSNKTTPSHGQNLKAGTVLQNKEQDQESKVAQGTPQKSKYTRWDDVRMLTKMDLSLLNTFVALVGYSMFPGVALLSWNTLYFSAATQLMAMTSQAINQIIERSYDKQMVRTCMRPLPRNRLNIAEASALSFALWAGASAIFLTQFPIGGFLVANTILASYILVYTPMKRTSEHNTAVGALVGALPPLLGWVSAGGAITAIQPWAVILFMFAWQFPHFYGILWTYRKDYDTPGYKMIKDPAKAGKIMRAAILGQALACCLLLPSGDFSYIGSAATYFYLYKNWQAVQNFEKDQSVPNAKKLKFTAYMPFTIFFITILLNLLGFTPEQLYKRFATPDSSKEATKAKAERQ